MTRPDLSQLARTIFVDTSAFFATANEADPNHPVAERIMGRTSGERVPLITSNYVVVETHALFVNRRGRQAGVTFLRFIEQSAVRVVWPGEDYVEAAKQIVYRYTDKSFSLTDAISFVIMEQLGITTAFTFDSDFRQYGFAAAQP